MTALLLLSACAGNMAGKKSKQAKLEVPAGVDSSVAVQAQLEAQKLFVEYQQQQQARRFADSAAVKIEKSNQLWEAFSGKAEAGAIDTIAAIESFNTAGRSLRKAVEIDKQTASTTTEIENLKKQSLLALQAARVDFERSILLNPFDSNTKLWLARTYQLLARRFLEEKNYRRASEILEHLLQIEKDQHGLYARLGDCYMALRAYGRALDNFRKAEQVLAATAVFDVPLGRPLNQPNVAAATDSSQMFLYLYYQGECHIKLLEADSALAILKKSLLFAKRPQEREAVAANVTWINWDDGNIVAAETRDSLLALVERKEFDKAARGFERLLPTLRSHRTRQEISWRHATLMYNHLALEDEALRTMQKVVAEAKPGNSVPDSMAQKYRDSYGAMCFNQGQKMLSAKKFNPAFAYFQQATEIDWSHRAKSCLELGRLAVNDPPRAEQYARKALSLSHQLDQNEEVIALELLTQALKRQGKFDEARRQFERYRELVNKPARN